jgi:16S rRNA (guanine(527)-N(7))-methyltransferase RsmG
VTEHAVSDRIYQRAHAAGLEIPSRVAAGCAVYLQLLARWNGRINLTALPLSSPFPDATVDKLIIEPLSAADLIPERASSWFDVGSGGGSPAVPLRLTHTAGSLTMVESRERKCAFLREVVRELSLEGTTAIASRFEEMKGLEFADLITVRAVRLDEVMADRICNWLKPSGLLMCFGASATHPDLRVGSVRLLPDGSSLRLFHRAASSDVPRGTKTGIGN